GPVSRAEGTDRLLAAVAREDLYWLGPHVGIDWADTPRAGDMADGVLLKTLEGKRAAEFEIKDWALEGGLVARQDRGVAMATVGSATGVVDFPASGQYILGLVARGTPCRGGWPIAQISIDGKVFGSIGVEDAEWHTVSLCGRVEQGRHKVSVAFTNDASDPPREDRNLYVEKLLVAKDDDPHQVRFLTSPPASAAIGGFRGRLVIDQIRWDTEQENGRKAARYATSLLTALGGDFAPRQGVTIECEHMKPQPGMPFFSNEGGRVVLACNGYVKTPIQVAAAGRYVVELVAAGTPAAGVFPLVEIHLDGQKAGRVQLASRSWRSYPMTLDLPAGRHELSLHFVNDYSSAAEDRNLMLDKAAFYPEEQTAAPRQ
ncbi:MAG: hypothetical protein NUV77_10080, partial [Thermoguttaceae bacterium]|nr:hypothetical protein [Thermoguttaceae bacterium]